MYQKEEKSYSEIISENLKYYMRMKDYSTHSLGKKIGVSSMTVSNWCRGVNMPKQDKIDALCQVFNISRDVFTHDRNAIPNLSIPAARPLPILGMICAGQGILGEESYNGYFFVDNSIRADTVSKSKAIL